MADTPIDGLPSAGTLQSTDLMYLLQGLVDSKLTLADLKAFMAEDQIKVTPIITGAKTLSASDINVLQRIGAGTFTITIPADVLGAALQANKAAGIPWRKIGSGTTTFAVSGTGATLTILGGASAGTAGDKTTGLITVESTTVATITGVA